MTEGTEKQDTVNVVINGRNRDVPRGLSLRGLLEHLELEPSLVVVERNEVIVERDRYREVLVERDDRLELVHFVGGGVPDVEPGGVR